MFIGVVPAARCLACWQKISRWPSRQALMEPVTVLHPWQHTFSVKT